MHLSSLLNRRCLLNGALLSVVGLVAAPALAQIQSAGGHYDYSTMTRIRILPHRAIRSRKDAQEYYNALKAQPRVKRAPNLRRGAGQAAGTPIGSPAPTPNPTPISSPTPVGKPSPVGGGGGGGLSAFAFGTQGVFDRLTANAVVAPVDTTQPLAAVGGWVNVAPQSLQPVQRYFYGPGPVTGRVNACTFDPRNSNIAYLAAPVGGIWKTINGGSSWTPVDPLQLPTQAFSCITVDPNNSSILYAGTGDYDRVDESGTGLYRSTDAGVTWKQIDPGTTDNLGNFTSFFQDHCIRQVLVDPANSNNVLVAVGRNGDGEFDTTGGIYRSTNALSANPTFVAALAADGNCHNLAYNSDRTAVYAAIESFDSFFNYVFTGTPTTAGVYKSTDNGATWTQVLTEIWFADVATSKLNPNTIYAIDGFSDQILKSTNGGATWLDTTSNFPTDLDPLGGGDHNWDFSNQSMYIATSTQYSNPAAVAAGGTSPLVDVVYVGLKDVYQSPNAGRTWGATGQVNTGNDQIHSEQHAIGIDPQNPNNLLVGNSGGVYRLRYNALDNSNVYNNLNTSLSSPLLLTQFYSTALHPTAANTMLGGARDLGTDYSFGSLFGWRGVTGIVNGSQGAQIAQQQFDGNFVALNPATPQNMYSSQPGYNIGTTAYFPIYVTNDNWTTITDITHSIDMESSAQVQVLALDPNPSLNYQHLYTGTNNLWLYDHVGNAWTEELDQASNFKPLTANGYVSAIAPSGIKSNLKPFVYVGCSTGEVYTFIPYFMAPTTQSVIQQDITFRGSVTSIVVSKINQRRIFVTTDAGEVYRCDDAIGTNVYVPIAGSGATGSATNLPAGVPVQCIALAAQDDEQVIFVGTDLGVYESADGGQTWANISASLGMPNTKVTSLDFNASTNYLTAGTFGRGIWRINVTNLPNYTQPVLNFNPVLSQYRGAKTGLVATVELRRPGSGNTTVPVETHRATLAANGTFSIPVSVRGHYDVYITIPRFLRKKLADVVTTSQPALVPVMTNGDAASPPLPVVAPAVPGPPLLGGDNVIDGNDITLITNALGQYTNTAVDLDGDGRVTTNDIAIARANLGKRGD